MLKLNQSGDTIIEVMVVLAVLGLALGISYATANRSLLNARQAQENSQATELVQSQIEQLRVRSSITDSSDPNYIYQTGHLFCMSGGNVVTGFSGSDPSNYSYYPSSPTPCVSSYYHLSVQYTAASPTNQYFTVEAVWDDVLGQGQDTVKTFYRVYPL